MYALVSPQRVKQIELELQLSTNFYIECVGGISLEILFNFWIIHIKFIHYFLTS